MEYTPEQLAAIYAEAKKNFTVEDLLEYFNPHLPIYPAEEVLAELERDLQLWKGKNTGSDRSPAKADDYPLSIPLYTPEQQAVIAAERAKVLTVEELIRHIDDDDEIDGTPETWEILLAKVEIWKKQKADMS